MTPAVLWLLAGAALLALEAFGLPGIGFLFAGIAAILVGALVELGVIGEYSYILQFALFLIGTGVFAVLLWTKLKNWRLNPNVPQYSNMLGTEAKVIGTLTAEGGSVKWSGTTMRARLDRNAGIAELPEGTTVIVTAVDGNVFTVAPK